MSKINIESNILSEAPEVGNDHSEVRPSPTKVELRRENKMLFEEVQDLKRKLNHGKPDIENTKEKEVWKGVSHPFLKLACLQAASL